jgi:uncharacterized protein
MNTQVHPLLQVAHLVARLKRVAGRKKMQKLVHILQELGHPFHERFEYSYYGMYSVELRNELDRLESENLLVEEPHENGKGDTTYVVKSTKDLDKLVSTLKDNSAKWEKVADQLNQWSAQTLEGISTILFFRNRGLEDAQLRQRVLTLKPHLSQIYHACEKKAEQLRKYGELN